MEWDRIEGNWKQFSGKVKEKWGQLTDADLTKINGKRSQLDECFSSDTVTGHFDRVVLLRFEDDAPYALRPDLATELGEALLEAFETVFGRPLQVLQ